MEGVQISQCEVMLFYLHRKRTFGELRERVHFPLLCADSSYVRVQSGNVSVEAEKYIKETDGMRLPLAIQFIFFMIVLHHFALEIS
jgi:hypothetical protein